MWRGIAEVYGMERVCEILVLGQIIQKQKVVYRVCNDTGTAKYVYVFQPTKVFAHDDLSGTTTNFAFGIY